MLFTRTFAWEIREIKRRLGTRVVEQRPGEMTPARDFATGARYGGLAGSPEESGKKRREKGLARPVMRESGAA